MSLPKGCYVEQECDPVVCTAQGCEVGTWWLFSNDGSDIVSCGAPSDTKEKAELNALAQIKEFKPEWLE